MIKSNHDCMNNFSNWTRSSRFTNDKMTMQNYTISRDWRKGIEDVSEAGGRGRIAG